MTTSDNYDSIRTAFLTAVNDPTGASDGEFCRAMQDAFDRIFAEELARELVKQQGEAA